MADIEKRQLYRRKCGAAYRTDLQVIKTDQRQIAAYLNSLFRAIIYNSHCHYIIVTENRGNILFQQLFCCLISAVPVPVSLYGQMRIIGNVIFKKRLLISGQPVSHMNTVRRTCHAANTFMSLADEQTGSFICCLSVIVKQGRNRKAWTAAVGTDKRDVLIQGMRENFMAVAAQINNSIHLHGKHQINGFIGQLIIFAGVENRIDIQFVKTEIFQEIMIIPFFTAGTYSIDDGRGIEDGNVFRYDAKRMALAFF